MSQNQASQITLLQNAATANGNGDSLSTNGIKTVMVEVRETAGGTCTLALQGSFDGANWYAVGYQPVDNQATLTRAVANISVTANLAHVYQILDTYPQLRAVISASSSETLTVKAYTIAA